MPWRLAEGEPGERVVCLKLLGLEPIYRSVFYLPEAPKVVQIVVAPPAIVRDTKLEQRMRPKALRIFKLLMGVNFNAKKLQHQKIWDALIYDTTNARDLRKEQKALQQFVQKFKRLPTTALDWHAVHVLAYML